MNTIKKLFAILIFSGFTISVSAEFTYANLQPGGDEKVTVGACRYFGQEKQDKKAIGPLINLLSSTTNSRVAVESALALGYIKEKGPSTSALKNKIMSTKDSDIVYASLLAILNITLQNQSYEADAKAALNYADKNHRSDEFVADMIDKIKAKISVLK